MKIFVTQEHINKGEECVCNRCPIALAFNDAGFPEVAVGPAHVDFYAPDSDELLGTWPLPAEANEFIPRFDLWRKKGLGLRPQPFAFEMPGLTSDLRSLTSDFVPVPVVTP